MTPFGFRALPAARSTPCRMQRFTALLGAMVGVCTLDVFAGVLLARGRREGATLGLATSPVAFILSIGFALPFLFVAVPIRGRPSCLQDVAAFVGRRRCLDRAGCSMPASSSRRLACDATQTPAWLPFCVRSPDERELRGQPALGRSVVRARRPARSPR